MPTYKETGNRSAQMAEYTAMKKELSELLAKKRALDRNLNHLEEQIYKFEGAYLDETQNGNIVRGFDNYLKGNPNKRRIVLNEKDRIFSQSSVAFMKSKHKEENER